jgi:bifunctional DNA-binding transcriptional regulator/antitoxin component of YhaV-PrlF toxin-antitoxin module
MGHLQLTTLSKANKTSESLRTTIPASIIKQFELEEGDKIQWIFEAEKGKIIVRVRPVKEKK